MEPFLWIGLGLAALAAYAYFNQGPPRDDGDVTESWIVVPASKENAVIAIAQAIASAEGFGVIGSRPWRNHNPGDMTKDLTDRAAGTDGPFVVFLNDEDGWQNLYTQVRAMLAGPPYSSIYSPGMSIAEVASHYTSTQQTEWAANVAAHLGVTPDTTLEQVAAA
jgi:hypothetical protein